MKEKTPDFMKALIATFKKEIIQAIFLISVDNTLKVFYSIYVGDIIRIITAANIEQGSRSDELIYSAIMFNFFYYKTSHRALIYYCLSMIISLTSLC